jgi:hypothetical protein
MLESVAYIEHYGLLRGWAAAAELTDPAALSGPALARMPGKRDSM